MCQYFPSDLGKYDKKTGSEREIKSLYEKKLFWGEIWPVSGVMGNFGPFSNEFRVEIDSFLANFATFRVEIDEFSMTIYQGKIGMR